MRLFAAVALVAGAACATWIGGRLARVAWSGTSFPLWDPAAHGLRGLDLADALRRLDVGSFVRVLNESVVWPFTNAFLLAPGFWLLGDSYRTADLVSSAWLAVTAVAMVWAGIGLHPTRGPWIGAIACGLLLASPAYRLFGTLTMLEMPGAMLLALALGLYARSGAPAAVGSSASGGARDPGRIRERRAFRAACAVTAALMFLKYNYGLLWLAPVLIHETTGTSGRGAREIARSLGAWARRRSWVRPFPLFVIGALAVLAAIVFSGGWDVVVAGHRISMHSPGNLAYGLYLVVLARGLWEWVRRPDRVRKAWSDVPPRLRTLLLVVGVPLAIWFLIPYPNRVRGFLSFLQNRSEAAPLASLERFLFYPRAFLDSYSPNPIAGALVLGLALVPPWRSRPGDPARFVTLAAWIGFVLTSLHGYHHTRFLFLTALLMWLCAARTAADLAATVFRGIRVPAAVGTAALVAATAAPIVAGALAGPAEDQVRAARTVWGSGPELAPVLDWIAARTAAGSDQPVLLGYSNPLSPTLVAWRIRQWDPEVRRRAPHRLPGISPDAETGAVEARARWLLRQRPSVLIALPRGTSRLGTPELMRETRGDSLVAATLQRLPEAEVVDSVAFREAGYVGIMMRRRRFSSAAKPPTASSSARPTPCCGSRNRTDTRGTGARA